MSLTALVNGERKTATFLSEEEWKNIHLNKECNIIMDCCKEPGTAVELSLTRTRFFRHLPGTKCECHTNKSLAHYRFQELLGKHLLTKASVVNLEHPIGENRIADVWAKNDVENIEYIFEVQLSPISIDELIERSCDYAKSSKTIITWFINPSEIWNVNNIQGYTVEGQSIASYLLQLNVLIDILPKKIGTNQTREEQIDDVNSLFCSAYSDHMSIMDEVTALLLVAPNSKVKRSWNILYKIRQQEALKRKHETIQYINSRINQIIQIQQRRNDSKLILKNGYLPDFQIWLIDPETEYKRQKEERKRREENNEQQKRLREAQRIKEELRKKQTLGNYRLSTKTPIRNHIFFGKKKPLTYEQYAERCSKAVQTFNRETGEIIIEYPTSSHLYLKVIK